MQLQDLLRVLQRSWVLIVLVTSLGLGIAAILLYIATPQYTSTARMFVSTQSLGTASELLQGSTYTQSRMSSYAEVATAPIVLDPVIKQLGITSDAEALAAKVTATVPTDSLIIDLTVTDPSPQNASTIANAIANQTVTAITTDIEQPLDGSKPLVAISIITPATPAASPSTPITWLYLVVGGVGGLLISLGAAFLLAGFDTRIRGLDEIKRVTEAPILGSFPRRNEARKRPLLLPEDMMSPRAESFRALRTNLQYFDLAITRRVLLFTSSIPSEGKTTTSLNLAITLAAAGQRVIIIEADMRRPTAAKYLNIEGSVGLSDVLVGRVALEDVVQQHGLHENLLILPAGSLPPNPSELLGSTQLADLITSLRSTYDYIVIDSPPLLAVTDAAILSRISDGVVLVVGAGRVNRQQVTTSFDVLSQVDAHLLGVAANLLPIRGVDSYSYYTYAYAQAPAAAVEPVEPDDDDDADADADADETTTGASDETPTSSDAFSPSESAHEPDADTDEHSVINGDSLTEHDPEPSRAKSSRR